MPFKNRSDIELFNDCLYFHKLAKDLLQNDEHDHIFDIRRALRYSFISLWIFWEGWLNFSLKDILFKKIMSIKGQDSLEDTDLSSSVRLKRILGQSFDSKLDLLILFTNIDVRKEKRLLKKVEKIQKIRNRILHPALLEPYMPTHESLLELNEAIETTREFFKFWDDSRGLKFYEYLKSDEPLDLKSFGLGFIKIRHSQRKN